MSRFLSEPLAGHDRSGFSSGHARIDGYFQKVVSQDIKRRYAACYVLIERDSGAIAGFYTLAANAVDLSAIPADLAARLPRYPTVPAVLLGWLGRSLSFRGQRIGTLLLADALHRIESATIAAYAVIADPIDDEAAAFYRRHQFSELAGGRMFLPIATARQAFAQLGGDGSG